MADIYVSPSGDNGTGDGSSGNPYQTVHYVLTNHEADGLVVKCLPGTYNDGAWYTGNLEPSGTITVESSTGDADDVEHVLSSGQLLSLREDTGTEKFFIIRNMSFDFTSNAQAGIIAVVKKVSLTLNRLKMVGDTSGGGSPFQSTINYGNASASSSIFRCYHVTFDDFNTAIRITQDNYGTLDIRNNIFTNLEAGIIHDNIVGSWTVDYNCFYNNTTDASAAFTGHDANGVFADPELNGNHHIDDGSPCFDAGVAIAGYNDGYEDSAPDIGYYETQANFAPGAPTNLTVIET
jgi:hypothetical protein